MTGDLLDLFGAAGGGGGGAAADGGGGGGAAAAAAAAGQSNGQQPHHMDRKGAGALHEQGGWAGAAGAAGEAGAPGTSGGGNAADDEWGAFEGCFLFFLLPLSSCFSLPLDLPPLVAFPFPPSSLFSLSHPLTSSLSRARWFPFARTRALAHTLLRCWCALSTRALVRERAPCAFFLLFFALLFLLFSLFVRALSRERACSLLFARVCTFA